LFHPPLTGGMSASVSPSFITASVLQYCSLIAMAIELRIDLIISWVADSSLSASFTVAPFGKSIVMRSDPIACAS